ncbi:SGNH/GDSL hydrolase family protein [Streptomyces sp. SID3343]|uniref:SGNH/GDSL hydrolase family protein n=1 Tax=Streptomyces sp. SID3343 TaxID=2690260 RepID=UPI00136B9925|nr:SGNH/GDSL hydrolase family protein [Streptomyces sp. SID3343]MYV98290.1 SGNH/GDSL hydrolase family protein [Streptomyces sp. SID3343]MYW04843.1 SGNH/GDSL hydrolase family protein [Streptomyces sp. SID3343]
MRGTRVRILVVGIASGALALSALATTHAAADPANGPYVALGDSYTAGPFIPDLTGDPITCGRSTGNYPSLVARELGSTSFTDASCSGATTEHMTHAQKPVLFGTNQPQFDRLNKDVRVVTLGIGGNDADLIDTVSACIANGAVDSPGPDEAPCADAQQVDGRDRLAARIDAVGPKVAEVLRGIHERAPGARVFVVGYPAVLPSPADASCREPLSLTEGDVVYLTARLRQLDGELADAARANEATFVDTYTSGVGHDACKPATVRWVEPVLPGNAAFPLHPNANGMADTAADVARAIRAS